MPSRLPSLAITSRVENEFISWRSVEVVPEDFCRRCRFPFHRQYQGEGYRSTSTYRSCKRMTRYWSKIISIRDQGHIYFNDELCTFNLLHISGQFIIIYTNDLEAVVWCVCDIVIFLGWILRCNTMIYIFIIFFQCLFLCMRSVYLFVSFEPIKCKTLRLMHMCYTRINIISYLSIIRTFLLLLFIIITYLLLLFIIL